MLHFESHIPCCAALRYQIHSATLESGVLESQPVLEQLAELQSSKQWRLGLSVSGELAGYMHVVVQGIRARATWSRV